jgi:hypothetical protein
MMTPVSTIAIGSSIPQNLWTQLTVERQNQAIQLLARLAFNWFAQQRLEAAHEHYPTSATTSP